jgi:alpha-beta hydrolase superfamily lysophospholipase
MSKHVFAIHGLGGRGAWFDRLAEELKSAGIEVEAPDLKGFGNNYSEGDKGHIKSYLDWIYDCQTRYQNLKNKYPGQTIAILGHSLGAKIASNLIEIFPEDRLILSVPGYKGSKATFNQGFVLKTLFQLFMDTYLRGGKHSYVSLPVSTKSEPDPSDEDPLKVREVSPNLLWQVLQLDRHTKKNLERIQASTLLIQIAGDQVVDNEAMDAMFNLIPANSKTKITVPSEHHDWIWYPEVKEIAQMIIQWLEPSYIDYLDYLR